MQAPQPVRPSLLAPLPPWRPAAYTDEVSGWAVAVVMLLAARFGRRRASEDSRAPTDTQWQLTQGRRKALSSNPEVIVRQREYEAKHAEEQQARAATSLREARRRDEAERRAREERERQYREEANRETARLKAELEAQRKAFEEREAAMAAELAERAEKERKIMEEQAEKRRAEREAQRLKEEEERRRAEEERARREAQERAELEAARRKAREEAEKLRKLSRSFAATMEASISVAPAPRGSVTEGPLEREAVARVEASCSTAVGGGGNAYEQLFSSTEDCRSGGLMVVGAAARSAADAYISAVQLQNMTGQGVLQHMDELELEHWMRVASFRLQAAAEETLGGMLSRFSPRKQAAVEESLQVRTERRVLPAEHPQGTREVLERAIALIESGDAGRTGNGDVDDGANGPTGATKVLLRVMGAEAEAADVGGSGSAWRLGAEALVLAHFLDRVLDSRPSKTSDAPGWFEEAAALCRRLLSERARGVQRDSLMPVAAALQGALPDGHPVLKHMQELAQKNMSEAARARMEEKQRIIEAELQRRLLQEEWPDREELAAARMEEIEANTPIPERCWALRNVAGTLSIGGPGERARALTMLRRAVSLKEEHHRSKAHPGLLPELDALGECLSRSPELQEEAAATWERVLEIACLVAGRYRRDGLALEAAALQGGAAAELKGRLGADNGRVMAAEAAAGETLASLPEDECEEAKAAMTSGSVIKRLVRDFTEDLAIYKQGKKSRAELWEP